MTIKMLTSVREEIGLGSPDTELLEITDPSQHLDYALLQSLSDEKPTPSIKLDLREKIRKRRQSEGLGELEVNFENQKEYKMRPEEITKLETRKARNRKSAHASREKRKQQEEQLNREIKALEDENQRRKNYVINLQTFERKLRLRFADHLIRCKSAEVTRLRQATNSFQLSMSDTVTVGDSVNTT
ncbi:transcriptional activator hac1-like [Pecten maximus]|uniref:transcriptional activator hac1-like n=1 Tax=Pecten maximus TaxID=6579 RepID=UPI0014589DAE|nr:transcriptional activator hac1-like [Pecten maximus]